MLDTLLNGRYKLLRVLGSGGFGQTYVAQDVRHEQDSFRCVVKQFQPLRQDQTFLEVARRLFLNEAEMLRRLGTHDRIPALLDQFEEDGQFYLVQEFVDGRSLTEELQICHQLTESQTIDLLRDVAEVLAFVHHENVIHRDIKPSNLIRRRQDDRFVVIDFGAVKELTTQLSTNIEPTTLTVGIATQGYGPSEQLAGKPRFSSDLYALGMTAIQALTGLHPSQLPTHSTTGEVIWRDRAEISPWLAAILNRLVRYHFMERFQSATDLLAALDQTAITPAPPSPGQTNADDETLIPATVTEPKTITWLRRNVYPTEAQTAAVPARRTTAIAIVFVGMASLVSTLGIAGMRRLGWLQPLELAAFDRMVQLKPAPPVDDRLLVVEITEADIQAQNRFPLSDGAIAQTIKQLQTYKPRAIGLDLFRDIPQEPGRAALLQALQAPNIIALTHLGNPITPAPPGVPPERVGFNDVPLDGDNVVRRNLVFADLPQYPDAFHSFALRLATLYLSQEGIRLQPSSVDARLAQLGQATLVPLNPQSGGYQNLDDSGYQIMLQYQGQRAFTQVSLGAVLAGQLKPEQVRDRIVLIGTTAANAKDLFITPYSAIAAEAPRMPGVLIHAHMVSQFLNLAQGQQPPLWYWSPPVEILWVAGWAVVAATVAQSLARQTFLMLLAEVGLVVMVLGIGYGVFLQAGWIPIAAPAIAILSASSLIHLSQPFTRYNHQ